MSAWELPTETTINERTYSIRSDFRAILDIITIMSDIELEPQDRTLLTLAIFYPDFDVMDRRDYQGAVEFMNWFVDGGGDVQPKQKSARFMDWNQDFHLIVAPVNHVLGFESRSADYLHWWSFLSAYMEIGDCTFAQVVSIRKKKAQGKKLDKSDQAFYKRNRHLVDLKAKTTQEEDETISEWIR